MGIAATGGLAVAQQPELVTATPLHRLILFEYSWLRAGHPLCLNSKAVLLCRAGTGCQSAVQQGPR